MNDISAYHDYKNLMESEESRREAERKARQDRIHMLLNRVPAVAFSQHSTSNNNTATHPDLDDLKLKEFQERREQFEQMLQQKREDDRRRQNEEMRRRLDMQVQEKRARKEQDKAAEGEYHKLVVDRVREEEEKEKNKVEIKKKLNADFKQNLMLQMGQISNPGGSSFAPSSIGGATIGRKRIQMEQLTAEEIKMNRAML